MWCPIFANFTSLNCGDIYLVSGGWYPRSFFVVHLFGQQGLIQYLFYFSTSLYLLSCSSIIIRHPMNPLEFPDYTALYEFSFF